MSTIEGIIFDMDGVLIESEPYHIAAEIDVFTKMGVPLTEAVAAEYLGVQRGDYIDALADRFSVKLDHAAVRKALEVEVEDMYRFRVPLVDGVAEVLPILDRRYNHRIGLGTSQERHLAEVVLRRLNVWSFFEGKGIFGGEVKNGKPDPEVFLKVAERIGVEPSECVVVEDARHGIDAGLAANMLVIARSAEHNRGQSFEGAHAVIEDLTELPRVLDRLGRAV